ncbi:MAG: polyprenol monophosphomannose synthase [Patescibacteria group bacterium]
MRKISKIVIIIPTYNEAQNLQRLTHEIKKNISRHDEILIVDDNSPDGTGKIADKIARIDKNIHVIHRKGKSGRGSAVFDGFRLAKKFSPDFYIEMDADFSHKPEDIPRLLKKVNDGYDVVIGSRYLPKSKIENWPLTRKIFSRAANLFAKTVLDVPISDYTNGYRIYSKKSTDFLLSQRLITSGYILLSETAYKLKNKGFTFGEIPIVFVNRKRGQSNTNLKEITDALLGILKIRFPEIFNRS